MIAIDSHRAAMQRALGTALAELHKAEEAAALLPPSEAGEDFKPNVQAIRSVREALEGVIDAQHLTR